MLFPRHTDDGAVPGPLRRDTRNGTFREIREILALRRLTATVGHMASTRRVLSRTATLGVPVAFLTTAVVSSVRTFRRLGALPSGLPDLPGERRSVPFDGGVVSFRYFEGSDPSREPVVLLHGWGSSGDASFFSVLPGFTAPVLVPDLPGHGDTVVNDEFSFDLAARAVFAAMDAVGVRPPHMVAHSMGGPVALAMIRMRPGCFSRLTAVATALHWQSPRMSPFLLGAPVLMSPVSPIAMRKLSNRIRAVPAYTEAFIWAWRNRPEIRTLRAAAGCLHKFDARGWAVTIPPTRWIVPEDDYMVMPSRQRRAARHLGAEVFSIAGAGHSFFLTDPDALLEIIDLPVPDASSR